MSDYNQSVQNYICACEALLKSVNSLTKRPKSWRKCLVGLPINFSTMASRE